MYECDTQVQAIRRGLISVIPARFLSLLTWKVLCSFASVSSLRFSLSIIVAVVVVRNWSWRCAAAPKLTLICSRSAMLCFCNFHLLILLMSHRYVFRTCSKTPPIRAAVLWTRMLATSGLCSTSFHNWNGQFWIVLFVLLSLMLVMSMVVVVQ